MNLSCNFCGESFKSPGLILSHDCTKHGKPQNNKNQTKVVKMSEKQKYSQIKIVCYFCMTTMNEQEYDLHMKSCEILAQNVDLETKICLRCNKEVNGRFGNHFIKFHPNFRPEDSRKYFTCYFCLKKMLRSKRNSHLMTCDILQQNVNVEDEKC